MSTPKTFGNQRKILLAASGVAAVFSFGCSSNHPEARWSRPVETVEISRPADDNQALAAADRLGRIIFGNTPTVAEPKLPSHWTVAKVTASH